MVRLGPFVLAFESDGDDPGTGIVTLTTRDGYRAATQTGVSLEEWNAFLVAVGYSPRA